jgi:low affinity Fe/Cu permease
MKSDKEKLNEQEEERDFFCIVNDSFRIFARRSSIVLGSAWAFALATVIIAIWGLTGPAFHFSNTWQLIINTGTTIVTFLMVFLIQNTQNRDSKAVNLKLDEIIRAVKGARNQLINLEGLSDEDLKNLENRACPQESRTGRREWPVLSRGSCDDCPPRAKVYFRRP